MIFLVGLGIVMSIIFLYVNYSMSATIREIKKNDWLYYATNYLYSHSVSSDNAGNRGDFVEFPENSIICKKCPPSRKTKKGGIITGYRRLQLKRGIRYMFFCQERATVFILQGNFRSIGDYTFSVVLY